MDLTMSTADQEFRTEIRDWLADHLVGEFARHRGVGASSDDIAWDVRVAWDRELASGGWLCIGWPAEYGGRGATITQQIVFETELARARPPFRAGVQGQSLFGPTLLANGTDEQKARFLPPIARGEQFWGQGFSEPGSGSDLASLRTKARLDDGEWVIDGQKVWMTQGAHAEWMYVLVRTKPAAPPHKGISMLVVPADQPGVEVRTIGTMTGGDDFCEVFYNGARTAEANVVGAVNGGWGVAMGALGVERGLTLLAEHLGIRNEVDDIVDVARARGTLDDPVLRDRLARAYSQASVMRHNNLRMMAALQAGDQAAPLFASWSKIFASTAHTEIGTLAMDVGGLASQLVSSQYDTDIAQRVFLGSRSESIYGGTTEIQLNIIGERGLGLPREPR